MKKLDKMISVLMMLCCVFSMVLPAAAAETETPRVVFENEPNDTPDLYITKHVKNGAEGYDAPADKKFSFILKLDGQPANRVEYRVFNANGDEVFNLLNLPFKTDRSGGFSLTAEQTAMFEYVGYGVSYEVSEVPDEDFQQIQPAGGSAAVGTVMPGGSLVEFTNLYLPEGKQETTDFRIRKSVSFPEGYEAPESPDFCFQVTLDGKLYTQEIYEIQDTKTGQKLSEGITDDEGKLFLKGGQTALFRQVPVDVDYSVKEEPTEGWRITGEAVKEGSTKAPATIVNFNNSNASFAVSKQMEDGSKPDIDFTFLLTRADRSVWADASYYLYESTGGMLIDDTIQKTSADGTFALKAGQTAVFTGADPGTIYNVSEVADPNYIQVLPNEPEGYRDKIVTDAVEVLPFINRQVPEDHTLTVTKIVENEDSTAPLANDQFTFRLYKEKVQENGGSVYEPSAYVEYTIAVGNTESALFTDADGKFILKANETARFTGLETGGYKVEEINIPKEYSAKDGETEKQGVLTEDGLQFVFVNEYTWNRLDLYLTKKNQDDQPLSGAKFMLYRDENMTNAVKEEPFISGADGRISIPKLKSGTYYLKEIQSPEGYQLLVNPIQIEFLWEELNLTVKVDGDSVGTDEAGQIYVKTPVDKNAEIYITVYNSYSFLLPSTGSSGIWFIITAGLIGIAILFVKIKKEGVLESIQNNNNPIGLIINKQKKGKENGK